MYISNAEIREFFEDHVSKCKDISLGEGSNANTC